MQTGRHDQWVQAVLEGNLDAYRHLVESTESDVRAVIASILPDRGSLDDAVQNTYLTAYRKLGDYRVGSSFPAWIKAVARNVARNERRMWVRRQAHMQQFRTQVETRIGAEVVEFASGMKDGLFDVLHECLKKIPSHARDIVNARYFEDVAPKEIARRAGRSSEWVRTVLFRARAALAECISEAEE
jgi:RNA polymerase sigma-70 factor (ECF subfamily)